VRKSFFRKEFNMNSSLATDLALRQHIVEYVCQNVNQTPLQRDPFPHIAIQDFFPADVYAELQQLFPELTLFEAFSYEKHHTETGESNRRRFRTSNDSLDLLAPASRVFWYSVRSALGSPELRAAVFEKLAPGLAFRYKVNEQQAAALPGYALLEVFHETDGYQIKPHPDTRKKVVTMQIALPEDEQQVEMGTEFYRRSLRPTAWLREPRGFDVVKRMKFLPNCAYAFTVLNTTTLKSWHGRTAIPGQCGARKSLLNIWYEKPEHGCPDLVAENQTLSMSRKAAA